MNRTLLAIAACAAGMTVIPSRADLQLARDGRTEYRVVPPGQPTAVDDYAVAALTNFLFQKTGAAFPVVRPENAASDSRRLFVGLSGPALQLLGADPLAGLRDQEYVVRSLGEDIFLYGKGMHGNLHAVVGFMENPLGRRWYTGRSIVESPRWQNGLGQPVFTVTPDLAVAPFARTNGFSFAYRQPCYEWMLDFHLQSGMNLFSYRGAKPNDFSLKVMPVGCHTVFGYIPPSPQAQAWTNVFGWLPKKDYFETHPEYFSLWHNGKRVPTKQLCFSNPDLRRELTANILEHIRRLQAEGQERLLLDLSAHDDTGAFCTCAACDALEQRYQSPGGPFYDYLLEIGARLKAEHPDVMLHTLAYRLSQTQKPPVLPEGMAFPDNIAVQFADVEDEGDVDWNHPKNRPHYEDLLAWCKLTPHVWTWYYPFNMMIDRLVTDIRLMKAAGVEGVFVEFSGGDYNAAIGFSELQIYVANRLLQDVDADVPALIRDFTDAQYGPAAEAVRAHLRELEDAWRASSTNTAFEAGRGMSRRLTGVTPAGMRRWQEAFDGMERLTAGEPRLHANVRRLRRVLDHRTLADWNGLAKAEPGYFSDWRVVRERMGALPPWMVAQVADWELRIRTAGVEKPLPAPFDGMAAGFVHRFVPERLRGDTRRVEDPDAAFGYAAVVDLPDQPLTFGFYQNDTQTHGARYSVKPGESQPGAYRIHPLGEVQLTPDCIVWFSVRSWITQLQLGERLYRPPSPQNDNRYDVYVSVKFDKPIPPTAGELAEKRPWSLDTNTPYSVLCDQIIFVKKPVAP